MHERSDESSGVRVRDWTTVTLLQYFVVVNRRKLVPSLEKRVGDFQVPLVAGNGAVGTPNSAPEGTTLPAQLAESPSPLSTTGPRKLAQLR